MKEKIEKFIKDNKLDLTGSGSELNSVCTILSGYALHLGIDMVDLLNIIDGIEPAFNFAELERVFKFAKEANYGDWWSKPKNRKMYKF